MKRFLNENIETIIEMLLTVTGAISLIAACMFACEGIVFFAVASLIWAIMNLATAMELGIHY